MKKMVGLFVLFFLISCTTAEIDNAEIHNAEITATPVHLRLGYCPTMQDVLPDLSSKDLQLESIGYPSAAKVMQALIAGEVDAALIGRKPYAAEMGQGYVVDQLRDGVTLISTQQRMIPYIDLVSLSIHTTLAPQSVNGLFPEGVRIIYHTEPVSADLLDQSSALLIDWAEVDGSYQLLIPVNEQGQKIQQFRTPFLVYASSNTANFQELISKFSSDLPE